MFTGESSRFFELYLNISEQDDAPPIGWLPGDAVDAEGHYYTVGAFGQGTYFEPIPYVALKNTRIFTQPDDFAFKAASFTPVVSRRFADLVCKTDPTAVQRIPVTFLDTDVTGFEILNVIRSIQGIDFERSRHVSRFDANLEPDRGGEIKSIIGLKIRSDVSSDYHIFRLQDWRLPVIVSAHLKALIEASGFTGVSFLPC